MGSLLASLLARRSQRTELSSDYTGIELKSMSILSPKPLSPQALYRGETARWLLPITTPGGDPKDLTGGVLRWALVDEAGTLMIPEKSLNSGIIHESGDPTLGRPIVSVSEPESEGLASGKYYQEWHITDSLSDVQVYRGEIYVTNSVLWATA